LRQELALVAGGARRLVLVSGEEGIGKSRLVAEVAADVVADDGLVLRGGWDEEGVTDFQAFREAFTRYLEGTDQAGARVPLGDLLPDLDALVPDATVDRPGGDDADRYRLLDALDSWLAQLASAQPVLLWLDDLQWADPSSLLMVQHLARSPRAAALAIVLTYQPAAVSRVDDLTRTLAQLRRSPGFEQIELSGLGTQSTRSLIARASTTNLAPRSLALLHEWSGGNPYFLHELVRLVDESAPLDGGPGERWVADLEELGAPDSIADVVRWRLARRSPRLARLLSVAAVVGTEFDAATLAAVLDADVEEVEDLLDDAAASGFIEELPDAGAAFSFRLDLVRQAMYQELPPRQRVRLHRRVLDNLLAGVDPDPAAVARHLSIAAGPDDLDLTVEFATAAAHRATEQMAFENAARHYEQALHVLERHPEPGGPRIELLIAAGEAHNRAGALGIGRRLLRTAAEEADRRDRPDLLARAGLALGGVLPSAPPTDAEAVELLRDIADRFPGDTPERARALVRQAEWLHRVATYDERRALVDEAVDIAERLGDPSVLGWVLNSSVLAMLSPDDTAAMPAAAERIILLGHDTNDDELAFSGWKLLLQGLFACGRMDEIRDVIATVRRLGKHLRQPEYLRIAVMWDATVATIEGRFGNARQQASEALTITLAGDHSQVTEIQLMLQIPVYGLRGTSAALRTALDDIERNGEDGVSSARAWFHAEAGELDEAHAILRKPRLMERIAERRWYLFWGEVVGYGTAAALLGDVERARQIRDLIAPYRDHSAVLGVAAFLGAVPHHCGVLNGVLGEWDDAVADLELGLERHRAMSARPWVALSQIELARVLAARDAPGDAARAAKLTAEATATADELGLGAVKTRAGQAGSGFDASRWASTDG
jgi:tetratricopeptide (TPR) repeat protein